MFMGGTTEQWIQLLEYCFIMLVIFIGVGVISCILTNKTLHRKNKFKVKNKKKSYFIDVA